MAASQGGIVWKSSDKCVKSTSSIQANGPASTQANTIRDYTIQTKYGDYTETCSVNWGRPSHYIRASVNTFKQVNGQWAACYLSPWSYNRDSGSSVAWSYANPGARRCGGGYYANYGISETKWNGSWRGDWIYSGRVWQ